MIPKRSLTLKSNSSQTLSNNRLKFWNVKIYSWYITFQKLYSHKFTTQYQVATIQAHFFNHHQMINVGIRVNPNSFSSRNFNSCFLTGLLELLMHSNRIRHRKHKSIRIFTQFEACADCNPSTLCFVSWILREINRGGRSLSKKINVYHEIGVLSASRFSNSAKSALGYSNNEP